MITNDKYLTLIRAMNAVNNIGAAAKIAGVHRNTAGKYLKTASLPSESKKLRGCVLAQSSAIDEKHWEEITKLLDASPELESTAAMDFLCERYPDRYTGKELRSLQRKMKDWAVINGKEKEAIFWQIYRPGERSQSDFVDMNYLQVKIQGVQFDHLIFHFMLPYSGWENVMVCEGGESFTNLCAGYERSVWKLRGVPKMHRTDNLGAAITASTRNFTDSWNKLMAHYNVQPTVNNPGKSNENGKVERSNGLIKRSIENQLCLRGYRDFQTRADYETFIESIVEKRNKRRSIKVEEEIKALQSLPDGKWYNASKIPVRVNRDSTIRVDGATYSVPTRTIGSILSAYLYPDKIEVYYGAHLLQTMPRFAKGVAHINFAHIISSLRKKPGAFEDYKYKECMYPTAAFRTTYDKIKRRYKTASKRYIEILYLGSIYGVEEVSAVLELFLKAGATLDAEEVKKDLPIVLKCQRCIYVRLA